MPSEDGIYIDRNSYERIWTELICPTIEDYAGRFSDIVVSNNAEEAIWQEYVKFNRHCKTEYMQEPNGKIDRHKVCACYMYAIVKAGVINCSLAGSNTERRYLALNENLAITVGLSLLRAFILANIYDNSELSTEERGKYKSRIDDGIILPKCNHGLYRENFVTELHYTNEERNYNILSLANTLFLLEIHTLETEVIHDQNKQKSNNDKNGKSLNQKEKNVKKSRKKT